MRFDAKTGKYVNDPQPKLGPVEKALESGPEVSGNFAAVAVAEIAAIGIDKGISEVKNIAVRLANIFKKKEGK